MTSVIVETHQSYKFKRRSWYNRWYNSLPIERKEAIRKKKLIYQRLRRACRGETKLGTTGQNKDMTAEEYVLSQLKQLGLKKIR
jgi:hypothetical protein